MGETKVLTFTQVKETKGTYCYDEQLAPGVAPVVGTLYVKKYAFGNAKQLEVAITPKS